MSKKKQEHTGQQFEAVENALTRTEQFIEDNQKIITTVVLVIVGLIAVYMGFQRFYLRPLENEAQSQMFVAQRYFEQDSFRLALNGDGNNFGFLTIIDEYEMTDAANLSKYYAGVSYLYLGQYDAAIDYLQDYDEEGDLVGAVAYGATGDAYIQLGETQTAVEYYEKAVDFNENKFTTPVYLMKLGLAYEEMGDFENALEAYQQIKMGYPNSSQGRSIDKYITRVEYKQK